MAETYHIYDISAIPIKLLATLTAGLRHNSRIAMLKNEQKVPTDLMLAASMADSLRIITHGLFTDDNTMPESILEAMMTGTTNKKEKEEVAFDTAEEYEAARRKLLEKVKNNV